jgi:hypothetical protein
MRSRVTVAALAQSVCLAVVMTAVVAGCGGGEHAAVQTTKTRTTFNARAVSRAFASVGLRLHDPAPSSSSPHLFVTVTMLTSVRPHQGWSVAAYIYPTPNQANASFAQDVGEWSASGIESVQVKNVVVVVIPRGHMITRRAHFFAMPKLVYKALDLLTQDH